MIPDDLTAINDAFTEMYDMLAGDPVTWVPKPNPVEITDATNETPIVVTAAGQVLVENAPVLIQGVEGNTATNGSRIAKNIVGNTFELYDPTTGQPIEGNGDYTETEIDGQVVRGTIERSPVSLLTIKAEPTSRVVEGLEIDEAGIRSQHVVELYFFKPYLVGKGVAIDPAGHWLILAERWDFAEDFPIKDALVPIGGLQNMISVTMRKAIELNSSEEGSEFTYGD